MFSHPTMLTTLDEIIEGLAVDLPEREVMQVRCEVFVAGTKWCPFCRRRGKRLLTARNFTAHLRQEHPVQLTFWKLVRKRIMLAQQTPRSLTVSILYPAWLQMHRERLMSQEGPMRTADDATTPPLGQSPIPSC